MKKIRFLVTSKVHFLMVLIGLIAMGSGDCSNIKGIRVFVSNQTEINFHIDSTDGMRVLAEMTSVLPVLTLTIDESEGYFYICREMVGCVEEVKVDASDYPWDEKVEGQKRFVNVTVVIEEPEPMEFEASCESENIKVSTEF